MDRHDRIYDIVARHLLGATTPEENNELERWIEENPANKALMEKLMQRDDIVKTYKLPRGRKLVIPLWQRTVAAVACAAAITLGVLLWNDYCKVVAPVIDEEVLAVMQTAQEQGRSEAELTIRGANHSSKKTTVVKSGDAIGTEAETADEEEMVADIVTHHDKEFWLTLPDGTHVHLNYNSSLTYPLQFTGDRRDVYLEGEAYFFVAKDRRHPFIVHTRHGDIKQYGTEFNVNTKYDSNDALCAGEPTGKGLAVVLVRGSVGVTPHGQAERMLTPSDLALVKEGSGETLVKRVDTPPYVSWSTGSFSFEQCRLDKLMAILGKWYGKKVLFANDALKAITVTGEVDRYEQIETILNSLSRTTTANFQIVGNNIEVY